MQGELQFKEHMLKKSGVAATSVQKYEGLEMGVLAPHAEHVSHRQSFAVAYPCSVSVRCSRLPFSVSMLRLQGPTRPELRIGNLVIQGRLVPLAKPLLVLTTRALQAEDGSAEGSNATPAGTPKRKRGEAQQEHEEISATNKARNPAGAATAASSHDSAASSVSAGSSTPRSCLQSVAIIRHKYVFTNRPYAICDMGEPAASSSTKAHAKPAVTAAAKAT